VRHADALIESEDRPRRGIAEREHQRGSNDEKLLAQPRTTGRQFIARRRSIGRRATLHDVGDEAFGARESDLFLDELKEQSSASADERLAALILVATGRLADHHQRRVQRTRTDDDALTGLGEHAARAGRKLG